MTWNYFIIFAIISVVCWIIGAIASWKEKKTLTFVFTSLGLAIFFSYILLMWITLERPPLRTMGETRLWYSFFLPLAGIITTDGYYHSAPYWPQFLCASISSNPRFTPRHSCQHCKVRGLPPTSSSI